MKAWKESASLILTAQHVQNQIQPSTAFTYNLLCLKRQESMRHIPGSYVFPGGQIDSADCKIKWYELFKKFGFDKNSFTSLSPNSHLRPQIFKSQSNELPREISLRITAIRETFEECGILLCKQIEQNSVPINWAQYLPVPREELLEWQEKVYNDATKFYTLCTKLKCYPDIWSLQEWSNWLTPTTISPRFDTVFYVACITSIPDTIAESTEVESIKWDTPENLLYLNHMTQIPQIYELTKLTNFKDINKLLEFAVKFNKVGIQNLYLPIEVHLQDGIVFILPHDSMYPEQTNLIEKQTIKKTDITIEEFRNISLEQNRVEVFNLKVKRVSVHNVKNACEHLSSMASEVSRVKLNKL